MLVAMLKLLIISKEMISLYNASSSVCSIMICVVQMFERIEEEINKGNQLTTYGKN